MKTEAIHTDKAPKALGPYSQAVKAGDFVFCSGQLGLDPASGNLADGVKAQTERALLNLGAILASEGLDFSHIAKTTVFLKDMADFAVMNEVYATKFKDSYPARSTVQVAALPKGGLVEIEAVAVR